MLFQVPCAPTTSNFSSFLDHKNMFSFNSAIHVSLHLTGMCPLPLHLLPSSEKLLLLLPHTPTHPPVSAFLSELVHSSIVALTKEDCNLSVYKATFPHQTRIAWKTVTLLYIILHFWYLVKYSTYSRCSVIEWLIYLITTGWHHFNISLLFKDTRDASQLQWNSTHEKPCLTSQTLEAEKQGWNTSCVPC